MMSPMSKTLTLDELIEQASHLSPPEKLRLVEVVQGQLLDREPRAHKLSPLPTYKDRGPLVDVVNWGEPPEEEVRAARWEVC